MFSRIVVFSLFAAALWGQFSTTASRITRGVGPPSAGQCTTAGDVSKVYYRQDAGAPSASSYGCSNNGPGTYGWEFLGSGSAGPQGPTGPTGPAGMAIATPQAVTSGVTTSVVIPFNGALTSITQALPSCTVTSGGAGIASWTSYVNTTTQMTIDFSGTTTAGFTGFCNAVLAIGPQGPTGPTGPTGPAGAGSGYCAPSSASATAYTCAPSPAFTSYAAGMALTFVPDVTSGTTPTLNINSLGAKNIKLSDGSSNPISGFFLAGQAYQLTYDGTSLRTADLFPYDRFSLYVPCDSGCTSSTGILTMANTGAGTPGNAGILIGSPTTGQLRMQNFGGSPRVFTFGPTDFLLGSSGQGGFTEINAVSGIKLNPVATTNVSVGAHIVSTGTAPTIASGFGTSPSIAATSTDMAGRVTVGTGGSDTSGVINFNYAWPHAPACIANNETTTLLAKATATTTNLTITSALPFTAADKLTWICHGF